jgi:hypothetical protein
MILNETKHEYIKNMIAYTINEYVDQYELPIRSIIDDKETMIWAKNSGMAYVLGIKTRICSREEEIEVAYEYQVPASAWDYVKENYLPKWFLKRFPAKTKTVSGKVKSKAIFFYPKIKIPQDCSGHVFLEEIKVKQVL